jgi:hypothetical protein
MIERAESAGKPEALPAQLAQHPTAIANTERAVSPMYEAADNQVMPKLRRNVADTMLDDSLTQNRFIGDERFINPRRMEKALDVNKDAYNALFGEGPYQQLRDASELGKAITRPTSLTNTSETARYSNLLKYGGMVPGAIIGAATGDDPAEKLRDAAGGMAAGVVIPRLAAKAWTGPMSRAVMGEAVKEPPKLLSPLASAIGRTYAAQKLTQPPKLQRPDDLPDDFLIDRARLASSGPDDLPDEFLAKPRKQ